MGGGGEIDAGSPETNRLWYAIQSLKYHLGKKFGRTCPLNQKFMNAKVPKVVTLSVSFLLWKLPQLFTLKSIHTHFQVGESGLVKDILVSFSQIFLY